MTVRSRQISSLVTQVGNKLNVLPIPIRLNFKQHVIEFNHTEAERRNIGFKVSKFHAIVYLVYHTIRLIQLCKKRSEYNHISVNYQYYADLITEIGYFMVYAMVSFISHQLYENRGELLKFIIILLRLDNRLKGERAKKITIVEIGSPKSLIFGSLF